MNKKALMDLFAITFFALFLPYLSHSVVWYIIPTHFKKHIDIQEKKCIIDFLLIYGTNKWKDITVKWK